MSSSWSDAAKGAVLEGSNSSSPETEQSWSSRIHKLYVIPASENARTFAKAYPISSMYIAFFGALSLLPIMCFCGISLVTLISSIVGALLFALSASFALIFASGLALFATLVVTASLSAFFTTAAVSAYLAVRLVFLVHSEAVSRGDDALGNAVFRGFIRWVLELRDGVNERLPPGVWTSLAARPTQGVTERHSNENSSITTNPKAVALPSGVDIEEVERSTWDKVETTQPNGSEDSVLVKVE